MARKRHLFINVILLLFTLIFTAKCSKLNVPRVLLPIFNDFSTNFTLEVTEGGCYKWTTSRLDLVQLIPLEVDTVLEQECSTRVVVLAISKEHSRNTAIVLAEDVYTGQVLRCDVIVDVITALNIVTTTRELFMEEAPEAFEVRAYDDQGNEFTTLEGVEFEWTLDSPVKKSPENVVIRFITFRDSPYETPVSIAAFEEMGKQGHIVLLEGVKTGSAKVSVRLPHDDYKNLDGIEVSLMVIANLIIEPPDVYILRGDVVHYKIIQVKHGRLEEIKLPSSQYYLEAELPDIGKIEKKSGYLTGINVGKTRVYLHDNNVKDDSGLKLPSATVYITYPERIQLTLLPHRNWATIVGEKHDIAVELYANNDHKIHIGEGVVMKTVIDDKFFEPTYRTANGSFICGTAIQQGPTNVHATLVSVISTRLGSVNLEPKLTASAEMLIHSPINLTPDEVILPWDPIVRPRYEITLKAAGGDSKFLWSTTNNSIGVVTQTGLVRTHFHGQFDTCASMLRNHHNRQCTKFFILPPSRMEIVEFVMEEEIGKPILLNIALFGQRPKPGGTSVEVPFTKCKRVPFQVKTTDSNFFHDEKAVGADIGISCTSVGVVGLTVGTARVTVQYKQDEINLEQTVTVAAYRPLKLLHPIHKETVLAVGTTRFLIFTGGPRPWAGRPSEHVVKISSSDQSLVEVKDSTQKFKVPGGSDTYVIKVTCKDIGEASVRLTIYNKPIVPKCIHKESFATATVYCAIPEYITLQPEIKVPDTATCPMDLNAERVIIQNYQNTDLLVTVKDSNGRRFDNISSLEFKWTTNPSNLATVNHKDGIFEKLYFEENVYLPNKTYQIVEPEKHVGLVTVEATIVGYKQSVLKANKVSKSPKLDSVTSSISLYLVDDTIVLPNRTSIYNHPLNKQSLMVKEGSGFNELALSTKDVAEVKYNEGLRQIEIIPIQPGELHVSVRDLCLKCPPVIIVVNVVYVAAIRVEMPDRVEVGKCIQVVVKFYDEFDNLMPLPNLEYLDARFSIADKIVNLKIANPLDSNWGVGEIHYVLTGLQTGETKVIFAAGRGPREVISLPSDIQVFSPIKINPRNATLLVGSVLQFSTQGGPQPDTNMEYALEPLTPKGPVIGNISVNGIFNALTIGHAAVTGRSTSINPINAKKVTNSKDTVEVHVVPLLGIKLSAPLTRFAQGSTIPVWATGIPEKLSSLLIGSVDPPYCYSWGTTCNDIISLSGIFSPFGVKDNTYNKISVRVKGLKPGICTVQLNVTIPGSAAGVKKYTIDYTTSIDLEVIEGLYLNSPPGFNGKALLLAPFSTVKLSTSKNDMHSLKYSVHGEENSDAGNRKSLSTSRHLIAVSSTGVITSLGPPGRAMVVITSTDDFGLKQTLSLVVQVKPVHYMLLTVQADWIVPFDENIKVVPLGSQFKLITSYHDDTGARFSSAHCDVNFRTSRQDLVEIKRNSDNVSFTAYTMKEGSTVLKVWADDCFKTADYVQIYSGQVSVPRTGSVTSGDVLCMRSSVTDSSGKSGEWSSEQRDVIKLNSSSGVGQVMSSSASKINLKYDLTPSASIGLDVEPISDISFIYDKSRVLNNAPGNVFKVTFVLKDEKHPDKESNMHSGGDCCSLLSDEITSYPFECKIEFDNRGGCSSCTPDIREVFEVEPAFNQDSGLYSCNIKPTREVTTNTSTIQSSVILKVISDSGIESDPLKIQFLPAVYIPTQDLTCDRAYTATLTVTGLPEVLKEVAVEPVEKKLIQVGRIRFVSETMTSFEIKIVDYHWKLAELHDPMSVVVHSRQTEQHVKVQVHLDEQSAAPFCARRTGSPLGNFLYEYKQTLIILLSMLILLFVSFYIYSQYMQPVINVNVAPGRQCAALRQHQCAALRQQQHQCAALAAQQQQHQCGALRAHAERSMMLSSPQQTVLNSTQQRTCCPPRSLNTSGSPTMRYGNEDPQNRSVGNSPELRRNRRFL